MSLFNRNKTVDGRSPESITVQRLQEAAEMARRQGVVAGSRRCVTTRGSYAIPIDTGSTGGGKLLGPYALYDICGDYVVCRTYNPTSGLYGSPNVFIAKEPRHRESLTTETILDVAHTYTYADGPTETNWEVDTGAWFNRIRTDDDGSTTEDQRITPPWRFDEMIYAVKATVFNEIATAPYWEPMIATRLNNDGTEMTGDGSTVRVTLLIANRSCQWAGPIT